MKRKIPLILIFFTLPHFLFAWGVVGHKTVAEIARMHLCKRTIRGINELLNNQSLASISATPDDMRYDKEYAQTGPWHYINPPDGLDHDGFIRYVSQKDSVNEYTVLNKMIADFKNPSATREQKLFALRYIVHLVGDIHQPLHAGRGEDLGGNKIKMMVRGKESNLHSVWDGSIIENTNLSYKELANQCNKAITKEQRKAWKKTTIADWVYESYTVSREIYADATKSTTVSYQYFEKYTPTTEERLSQAGIRLAEVLNSLF
ncbi:S1/P1 nuclease [Danxiaibacter flavus]|uniref:S1/P1 nuclease n=1 Tax=Danxiaibacter flavus TaxID=3049108 RepID=A0ABV3ZCT4_9BACT|nr:S1/P1 nuclease [Chitinophagaceae bacterium DXS]